MANFNVNISDSAIDDIRDIQEYISIMLQNPEAANRRALRIFQAAEALSVFPKMHRVRGVNSKGEPIRFCPVDKHVIIYHIDEENRIVHVVRVRYGKSNLEALIN